MDRRLPPLSPDQDPARSENVAGPIDSPQATDSADVSARAFYGRATVFLRISATFSQRDTGPSSLLKNRSMFDLSAGSSFTPEKRMTGSLGFRIFISRASSAPFIPGISRSVRTRS